jgi:hypothetical protein
MLNALGLFFDQYVFGHYRAALLATQLPASDADRAEACARQAARLRTELARIDAAERGLISELEAPADPAAQAYRARIRARFGELYAERTTTETRLAELENAAPADNDPGLLNELSMAAGILDDAPARIKEALLAAFQVQALYNNDDRATIPATLTADTPGTIAALLADPAPTTTAPPNPRPAAMRCHIWDPSL